MQLRLIEQLMNMQIHQPRNRSQLIQQLRRVNAIGIDVQPDHLHVNRRGQSEIQNLADNIRR